MFLSTIPKSKIGSKSGSGNDFDDDDETETYDRTLEAFRTKNPRQFVAGTESGLPSDRGFVGGVYEEICYRERRRKRRNRRRKTPPSVLDGTKTTTTRKTTTFTRKECNSSVTPREHERVHRAVVEFDAKRKRRRRLEY